MSMSAELEVDDCSQKGQNHVSTSGLNNDEHCVLCQMSHATSHATTILSI